MQSHRGRLGNFRAAASRVALLSIMALALALTGCDGDTPRKVIGKAAYDVAHLQLDDLKATLTGDALLRFGNPAGMEQLRARIGKVVSIGDSLLVSHVQGDQGGGNSGDVLRTYRTKVAALSPEGATIAVTVDTLCKLQYQTYYYEGATGLCTPDPDGGPDVCTPDTPPSDYDLLVQYCLVSGISLPGSA